MSSPPIWWCRRWDLSPRTCRPCGACKDLAVTRWGTIKADFRSHATSLPGVYAAGDIVRGASLVVWAIRDGREAADSILTYLAQPAAVAAE